MKRTMLFGLILSGVIAVANGCTRTPTERDYHEYAHIRAGQPGSGDALGQGLYARQGTGDRRGMDASRPSDGEMNGDVLVGGPAVSRQAPPRRVSPSYMPPRPNVAGVPQD
jgi:hypothetical protein